MSLTKPPCHALILIRSSYCKLANKIGRNKGRPILKTIRPQRTECFSLQCREGQCIYCGNLLCVQVNDDAYAVQPIFCIRMSATLDPAFNRAVSAPEVREVVVWLERLRLGKPQSQGAFLLRTRATRGS